jgi:hypothetical protein
MLFNFHSIGDLCGFVKILLLQLYYFGHFGTSSLHIFETWISRNGMSAKQYGLIEF